MQSVRAKNNHGWQEKAHRELPSWVKVLAWLVTTAIAAAALAVSIHGLSAQESAKKLANEQSQQIAELQKTTPVGEITGMAAYRPRGHQPPIARVRDDPVLRQQIYNLSGVASDVPDNGSLFMVVHDYGQPAPFFDDPSAHFFITHVTLYSKSGTDQHWKAKGVYIGRRSAPDAPLSYRLTLYFCNSVDAQKIVVATHRRAARNYGLSSLPYPSCKQLDSIFVTRGTK